VVPNDRIGEMVRYGTQEMRVQGINRDERRIQAESVLRNGGRGAGTGRMPTVETAHGKCRLDRLGRQARLSAGGIVKDKHPVSSALFGVAAIQAVVGFLGWSIHSVDFAPIDWGITFSFVLFAVLALLARWARVLAAIIATALYGGFLLLQASVSIQLLTSGLIFKVPNVVLLLVALAFALKPKKPPRQDNGIGGHHTNSSRQRGTLIKRYD
jgi:hypothetical protein